LTFFVDANVVLYAAVDGPYRDPCLQTLEAVAAGEADGRTSTAVLEEVWHIERSGRIGDVDGLADRAYAVFTPLLAVTDEAFRTALELDAGTLGTNVRLHAATCVANGIGEILSADRGFEEVHSIRRTDPLDARALRRLLR